MPIQDTKTRQEAISQVLEGLQWLIVNHASATAREQYLPERHADASDDFIKENKKWVEDLRMIRGHFEDLVTGLL